jgi:hypothetical protein
MNDQPDELVFDVQTPMGFRVRVSRTYWSFLTAVKHPVMAGREAEVRQALTDPDEVRRSRIDSTVYLFYASIAARRWVCAVAKKLSDDDGFLITAYPTDAIKEGDRIWPK